MKRVFALVLACLLVVPALIVPTSATKTVTTDEATETKSVVYSFTSTTESELAYLDKSIGEGSLLEKNRDNPEWWGRYVDGSKFYGYAFPITTTGYTKLTFSAMMRGDIYVQVSLDKVNWETAATMEMLGETAKQGDAANRKWRDIDLTAAYNKLGKVMSDTLYLRFGDYTPDGYGTNILASHEASLTLTAPAGTRDNIEIISFNTAKGHTGEEANYYHPDLSRTATQGGTNDSCHFADRDVPFVYAYDMRSTEIPEALTLSFKTANQLKLDVSTDAYHWINVYTWEGTLGADGSGGLAREVKTFDLLTAYKTALASYPSNMLYVRIGDSYPANGWGGSIYHDTPFTLSIFWPERVATGEVVTLDFTVQGDDENDYFVGGGNVNGNTGRYADGGNKVVYKYPLTNVDTSSEVMLTATFTSQLLLEVSLDNVHWVRAFKYYDIGTLSKQNANDETTASPTSQNGYFFPKKERTIDLTAAIAEAAKVATSKDAFYVRVGDAHPTRVKADGTEMVSTEQKYNSGAGWGGQIHDNVTLTVRSSDSMAWVKTQTNVVNQFTSDGTKFYLKGSEPMLVTSGQGAEQTGVAPIPTVKDHGSLMTDNKDGTFTFKGNGTWSGRAGDNGVYFIYKYDFPNNTTELSWTAWIGGGYGIDIAFGSSDYASAKNSLVWTNWANHADDGHAYNASESPKKTLTHTLTEAEAKTDCIYIKVYDYDTAHSGYGGRVMFGTNYPITMQYNVSVADEVAPTVKSGQLNLTQNFNVAFKLNTPGTSNGDETVQIGWADGALSTVAADSKGAYNFIGIRPERMGDEIKLVYSGTCLDNTPYTSTVCTYSVKDYCQRMITNNASDTKLVTLLSDILAYGAAAQTYAFVPENELVTEGVTGMTPTEGFTVPAKLDTVLSRTATDADNYTWRAVTLVLDTTTAIRYSFRVKDGAAMPTISIDGSTVTSFVSATDDKGTYYYFDFPVYANQYGTAYTAAFAGVDDYTVTYSVNHYIAAKYDESLIKTSALLRAIYNYGASVCDYLGQ